MKTLIILSLILLSVKSFSNDSLDIKFSTACDSKNTQITLSVVGDILIHEALYEVVVRDSKHFSQIWKNAEGLFQKADFSIGNLEGPTAMGIDGNGRDHGDIGFVYDNNVYSGTNYSFNYHPRILSDLKNSGFDLVTTANNHTLDRDSIGIDKTILAAQAINFPTIGTRLSNDSNGEYFKIESINNVRVAFLGCTELLNEENDSKNQILRCYKNPEKILGIIKRLSSRADIDAIVVFTHWGIEYSHVPELIQREFARKYIEAGANVVVGSHPHVLQPWEKYVAANGREGLVIYSLGNFVAGQAGLDRKTGTVAYIGLSKKGNEKARIFGAGYTPTYRTGAVVYPIGGNGPVEVLKHTASMYGTKRRIEPSENLMQALCSP